MAVQKRNLLSENAGYVGVQALNAVDAGTVVSGVGAVSFFELAPGLNASQYKCCVVFVNVSGIVGTWNLWIATELRVAQVALGTSKFNPAGMLIVTGLVTNGNQRVGYNLFSGVNAIVGDVVYLEVRNTAGASPTITLSADSILYN